LAFVRHAGPYEAVPETLFDTLEDWATNEGLAEPRIWMGIGHDAPRTTRSEHLRFDAAVVVPAAFKPRGPIGHQVFEGGEFAVTTHAGPFVTLAAAYAAIFPRVTHLPKHQTDRLADSGNLSDGTRQCPTAVECDRHLSARGRFRRGTFLLSSSFGTREKLPGYAHGE